MDATDPPLIDAPALRAAALVAPPAGCATCAGLVCPGWEAMPAAFARDGLRRIGTLCNPAIEAPTVEERNGEGRTLWSADAQIALEWFPYNRCELWACTSCKRSFLRYTEYGGYYVEERIRQVDAKLVADVPFPK